jgi:hypothetical protein
MDDSAAFVNLVVVSSDKCVPLGDYMVVIGLEISVPGLVSMDILDEVVDLEEELLDEVGLLEAFDIVIVLEVGAIDIEIFVFEPDQDTLARETDGLETFKL